METWKEFDQNIITHSAAHHLMAIDELVSRLGYARVSDVARQLGITRGSVSISLQPLKKAGLVEQDENRHLRLSETSKQLVASIKTKRHLLERLFRDILGVTPAQAAVDACKFEHLASHETARRVLSLLRHIDAQPDATAFFERWRASEALCDHEPASCPSCEHECLASVVDTPKPERKPR